MSWQRMISEKETQEYRGLKTFPSQGGLNLRMQLLMEDSRRLGRYFQKLGLNAMSRSFPSPRRCGKEPISYSNMFILWFVLQWFLLKIFYVYMMRVCVCEQQQTHHSLFVEVRGWSQALVHFSPILGTSSSIAHPWACQRCLAHELHGILPSLPPILLQGHEGYGCILPGRALPMS